MAIYECNWYDAPIIFRKMIIMFQIRMQTPVVVHAKPFYELNFAQLGIVSLLLA